MAEERSSIISPENLPTVSAVGFILGLLAFVMALWGKFDAIRLGATIKMSHENSLKTEAMAKDNATKIGDLDKRVGALEAAGSAAAAAAAPPAADAAATTTK